MDSIDKTVELSESYWSVDFSEENENDLRKLEIKLIQTIKSINKEVARLGKRYFSFRPDIRVNFITFKQAVTGGNFATKLHRIDISLIEKIGDKAEELRSNIKDAQHIL